MLAMMMRKVTLVTAVMKAREGSVRAEARLLQRTGHSGSGSFRARRRWATQGSKAAAVICRTRLLWNAGHEREGAECGVVILANPLPCLNRPF